MKHDITQRSDLFTLVVRFYAEVRKDDLLGPIFNAHITDWPHHMNKITDFWERNLLQTGSFNGNPGRRHIELDMKENNTISQKHFDRWLALWHKNIDQLYAGLVAEDAKGMAMRIGGNFLRMIMNNRGIQKLGQPDSDTPFRPGGSMQFRPDQD